MGVNLAGMWPVAVAIGTLLTAIEWAERQRRAAARDTSLGSRQHRQSLAMVDDRTAPCFTDWRSMPAAEQAAWDAQALDRAADLVPPLPDVDRRDTR